MGSSAKNYKPNGDTTIIGGVLNVVGNGQIQKDGVPVDIGGGGGSVAWADVTGKPATFAPTIGTTASTAAAGNHTHTASVISTTSIAGVTGTNVQAVLAELAARVATLEGGG